MQQRYWYFQTQEHIKKKHPLSKKYTVIFCKSYIERSKNIQLSGELLGELFQNTIFVSSI